METLYFSIYVASATGCLVVALILLGIRYTPKMYNKEYVKIKNFMALAAFIACLNCLFDIIFGGVRHSEVEILSIPVLVGLYAEVLIFTGCFLTIFHSKMVHKKGTFLLWLPMLLLLLAYGITFLLSSEKRILSIDSLLANIHLPIVLIRVLISLLIIVMLPICIYLFYKSRKKYNEQINNYFTNIKDYRNRWVSASFYTSVPLCILAWLSFIINNLVFDTIVTILVPVWFFFFIIKYINYQYAFYKFSIVTQEDTAEKIAEEDVLNLLLKVNEWCKRPDKPYREKELTINDLADSLSISVQALSQYINAYCNANFNDWINKMRLDDAIAIMQDENNQMTPKQVADLTGFEDESVMVKMLAQKKN